MRVVMEQFTRRIIDFGVHTGDIDETALCQRFYRAIFPKVSRTTPVRSMTHYSNITAGRGILVTWMSRRSKHSLYALLAPLHRATHWNYPP